MNLLIEQHFEQVEIVLLQSPIVLSYRIIRREVALGDGKLRIKATLRNGDVLELFEYVIESGGLICFGKYSFHWQDIHGNLKQRWDNALHHPELPGAPHHIHRAGDIVDELRAIPDIFSVIAQIQESFKGYK
jgi:hypothetical protein